ncbi:MAG: SgcJ/EcaC family oxidoreductase [Terriglobia bacterium]
MFLKLMTLLFLATSFQTPVTAAESSDEATVREVIRKYVDARNHRDDRALLPLIARDADQLVSTGEWRRGLEQVVEGAISSSQKTGGIRTIVITSIRFIVQGVALVDGRYSITGQAEGQSRAMWTTILLVRSANGSWRIEAIRNMLPSAPMPSK